MGDKSVFPDKINIESALELDGENPTINKKGTMSDSTIIPFNNEICSVAKGIYLDLGPATRHLAPVAQVFCSKLQKT